MKGCLVTGGAGFLGSHLCERLVARGERVICLDNFNSFYDPAQKRRNIAGLAQNSGFTVCEVDLRDTAAVHEVFARERPSHVAHFAAMANPRRSIQQPHEYVDVNVGGSLNILEAGVRNGVENFVLVSTSSVYGVPEQVPWAESEPANRPLSPYGATKKAAEVLAYSYHALYGVPTTVIRPFTVFGPRGRPDMTPHLFVRQMVRNEPLTLYNGGHDVYRDWTYVGDFMDGFVQALDRALQFEIINLGNSNPVEVAHFVAVLQQVTGLAGRIESPPVPAGEPRMTFADITKARQLLGYDPRTSLEVGLSDFWEWYRQTFAELLGPAKGL
ncbi:MAG: GDP-mannose 4,6-dehydratase [Herpetosiphon sp.]